MKLPLLILFAFCAQHKVTSAPKCLQIYEHFSSRFIFKWCHRVMRGFGDLARLWFSDGRWLKLICFCHIPQKGIRCEFERVALHICRFDQIQIDWLTESVEVKMLLKGLRLSMDWIVIDVCRKTRPTSYDSICSNAEMGICMSSAKHCRITLRADDLC